MTSSNTVEFGNFDLSVLETSPATLLFNIFGSQISSQFSQSNEYSPNCALPLAIHPRSPSGRILVKSTEVSLVIKVGNKTAKLCEVQHFKDVELFKKIEQLFPPPHPSTEIDDEEEGSLCDHRACVQRPFVNDEIAFFSASHMDSAAWHFCSLDCCLKHLQTISDSKFRTMLLDKGIKQQPKKRPRKAEIVEKELKRRKKAKNKKSKKDENGDNNDSALI